MEPTSLEVGGEHRISASSAEDFVGEVDEDLETCIAVVDAVQFRSEFEDMDFAIMVITPWLADQKFGNRSQRFILVNEVTDVTADSYLCEGCFVTTEAVVSGQTTFDEDKTALTIEIDESDGEYVDDPRTTFLPKSQIESVIEFSASP